MNASSATAGLGLLSSASWGASDFAGGLGARRYPALLITISGHFFSFLVLLGVCLALHLGLPGTNALLYAAAGGLLGSLGLAIFYTALAMGSMGLTAAISGLLTALVPVCFSALRYGLPTRITAAGLATGCVAIWLITHQGSKGGDSPGAPGKALLLGALAGASFGSQLVLFKFASAGGTLWVMTAARAAGVAAVALVLLFRPASAAGRGFWFAGIIAGCLDTFGNLLYLRASQLGRLDAAAVICSLYPAFTIALAALVLRERPTRRQFAGMALALAAVLLLSMSGPG